MKIQFIILIILFSGISTKLHGELLTIHIQDTTAIDSAFLNLVVRQDTSTAENQTSIKLKPPALNEIISFQKIFWSIIFILSGYIGIKILTKLLDLFAERSTRYRITIKSLIPMFRIAGWVFILFVVISGVIQPPMATLLAFAASVGVAVGFAAQDLLKNIFGGITILFDRPFNVGDKIEIGDYYGEVVEIGLRSTRIVTPDDSLVTVPNGEIMNQSVSNSNAGEPNCQVVAEIFLPVNTDTSLARKIAIEAAQTSRYVYLKKPVTVLFFNEIKERKPYLKMRLKAYVLDIRDEFAFKSDMTEIVLKEFIKSDIVSPDEIYEE